MGYSRFLMTYLLLLIRQDKSHLDQLQDRIIKGIFYNNNIFIPKVQLVQYLFMILLTKKVLKILKSGYKKYQIMQMNI